jgi:hypothetical protein
MATQSVSMDKSSHRMRGSFSLAMMSKVDTIFMKYDADGNGTYLLKSPEATIDHIYKTDSAGP